MNSNYPPNNDDPDAGEISKTRRKKQSTELQKLGEDLLSLNKKQLELIEVPEPLLSALKEYQRLPNRHEAKRRQLQFIGKLMRGSDHETIRAALEKLRTPDRREIRRGQEIERWGEQLLAGEESDIEAFLDACPLAERQPLRQLMRNYRQSTDKDTGSSSDDSDIDAHTVNAAVKVQRRRLLDYIKTCIE